MIYLFLLEIISFSKNLSCNKDIIFILSTCFIVSIIWSLCIGSLELIEFYLFYFLSLAFSFFITDPVKIYKISKLLLFITCFLMIIVLVLSISGNAEIATTIKSIVSLPTNSRDITQYGSGILGNIPLLNGIIVRHVLYFDQPSTFSSFIFILGTSIWIKKDILKKISLLLLIIFFCPSKIAIFISCLVFFIRWFLLFKSIRLISLFNIIFIGFIIGHFLDFKNIDLANTLSARLYWTDLLFSGTAPWNLIDNCVGNNASCIFGVYDGFIVKLPIIICALILSFDSRYKLLSIAIVLSSLFTIQYGINFFYSPLTVLTYAILFNNIDNHQSTRFIN